MLICLLPLFLSHFNIVICHTRMNMSGDCDYSGCSTTTTTTTSTLYTQLSLVLAIVLLIACMLGIVSNLISTYIYTRRSMRAPINVLLAALGLIDVLMLIGAAVVFVIPGANVQLQSPLLVHLINYSTVYVYPFTMMAQSCSIGTLLLITIERYLAVSCIIKCAYICVDMSSITIDAMEYSVTYDSSRSCCMSIGNGL
jgi:hypothetical protein